jgi:hypothetical protein
MVEAAISAVGAGIYAFGLIYVLDRLWQLTGRVAAPLRRALLLFPPASASGIALALAFYDRGLGAVLSVAGAVALISGAVLWAIVRLVVGPPQIGSSRQDAG